MTLKRLAVAALVLAAFLALGGCIYDISTSTTEVRTTAVLGKVYDPPRTEIYSVYISGDKNRSGHTEIRTRYIPESYRVITKDGIELSCRAAEWHGLEKGTIITITHIVGGITGFGYPWTLSGAGTLEAQ